MAILDSFSIGNKLILTADASPATSGVAAALGSLCTLDGGEGVYLKTGPLDTDWELIGVVVTIEITTANTTTTLPTAVGRLNRQIRIINASIGKHTVTTTSSQTIGNKNGTNPTSIVLKSEEWLDVLSNNTNWRII